MDRTDRTDPKLSTIHDTHVQWLVSERSHMRTSDFVNMNHVEVLAMWSGSSAEAFNTPGKTRRAVLDVCFRPLGVALPTIVVMSGWEEEDGKDMARDMRDYITHGNGAVKMVIALKWNMDTASTAVSCELKVWKYIPNLPNGTKYFLAQRENILPGPSGSDKITITLGDLCGSKVPPGQSSDKQYSMSVRRLRGMAVRFIREDGFRPEGSDEALAVGSDSDPCDDDEPEHSEKLTVATVPPTTVGLTVGHGSSNQSHVDGDNSANNRSNNLGSFNENYRARTIQITNVALTFSHEKRLRALISPDSKLLQDLASRCAETGPQVCDDLQVSYDYIPDLAKVALYDTIVLCDDSGSMKHHGRYELMHKTILAISDVCTAFRDEGITIKFLNFTGDAEYNEVRERSHLDQLIAGVTPRGLTRLGTVLRRKIIEPRIVEKARNQTLTRPVLVTIITDGEPKGEDRFELKKTIIACKRELEGLTNPENEIYGESAVVFQISLVGDSDEARKYIEELERDPEVGHLVFCTKERLDLVKGRKQGPEYTGWLIQLLAAGIDY